ncbi:MAG: hypothetical protein JWM53_1230 [bacterium]|nr:hypothetical protein [bacterium]
MSVESHAPAQQLGSSCERIRAEAAELRASAASAGLQQQRAALTSSVAEHLRLVDELLSALARRRLLHDHRRLTQLMRAIELAVDDGDAAQAAAAARKLEAFIVAHDGRERAWV